MNVPLYSVRSSASLFNDGKTFWLVMMTLGGDRVIITLQTTVRDRGRRLVIAPVLSLCKRRNVSCSRLSGMTRQGLLTTVNDPDNISGLDMLSSGHDACECRVPPLGSPDKGACHMSSRESGWSCSGQRCAPRVIRGRGPYKWYGGVAYVWLLFLLQTSELIHFYIHFCHLSRHD